MATPGDEAEQNVLAQHAAAEPASALDSIKARTGALKVFNGDADKIGIEMPAATISAWTPLNVVEKCCNVVGIVPKILG